MVPSGAQWHDKRKWAQTEIQKIQLKKKQQKNTNFFTVRVGKHWKTLPRKLVESPFLEILKTQLVTKPWATCYSWSCFEQGSWSRLSSEVPSNVIHPVKLWICKCNLKVQMIKVKNKHFVLSVPCFTSRVKLYLPIYTCPGTLFTICARLRSRQVDLSFPWCLNFMFVLEPHLFPKLNNEIENQSHLLSPIKYCTNIVVAGKAEWGFENVKTFFHFTFKHWRTLNENHKTSLN